MPARWPRPTASRSRTSPSSTRTWPSGRGSWRSPTSTRRSRPGSPNGSATSGSRRDWRSLVAAEDIDLVVVCLPPVFNREVVLAVAAAGKHVVCEKPLGASADIAAEMLEACQTAGVFHGLAAGYRWSPAVRAIAKLVRDGELGTIRSLRAAFMLDYAADPEVPLLWRFRQGSGRRRDRDRHGLPPRRLRAVHRRRDRRRSRRSSRPSSPTARCRAPTRSATAAATARGSTAPEIRAGRRRGRGRRPRHLRRRGVRRPRDQPRRDRQAAVAPARGLRIAWLGRLGPRAAGRVPGVPARRPVHLRVPAGPREPGPPGRRRAAHRRDRRDLDRLARPGMRDVGRVPRRDRRGPSRLGRLQRRRSRQCRHRCALRRRRERHDDPGRTAGRSAERHAMEEP